MTNSTLKKDLSILLGNTLDHFDTSLFGFLAPVMAPVFFPNEDPLVQLILTYGILVTSIWTRPLGAIIFGIVARKYGPLISLSYSLIGVAVTTFAIGCIPSFNNIGIAAPILLIIIRMVRGVFSSGEITVAKLYIMENKPQILALKVSSLYQTSTIFGIILASIASWLVISTNSFELWRLCFWIGGLTGFFGYVLRKLHTSTPSTLKKDIQHQKSTLTLLLNNKINIIKVAIITSFSYVTYSIPFIVMNNFIPLITKVSLETMMAFNTALLVFDMLLIPLVGKFSQNFSPRHVMLAASSALAISILPLWYYLENSSIGYISFVRCWIVVLGVAFMIPVNLWYKKLFNDRDQYILVGIGNALGTGIIGHMVPTICLTLWYFTNSSLSIGLFIMLVAMSAIFMIFKVKT